MATRGLTVAAVVAGLVAGVPASASGALPRSGATLPGSTFQGADGNQASDGDLVDPLGRQLGVPADQLPDAVDDQVVGAGLGVHGAGFSEGGADAVDEDDSSKLTRHAPYITGQ